MRSLAVSLVVFMALAVLAAHGKKQGKEGKCKHHDQMIKEGETVTLQAPCEQVKCEDGKVQVLKTCPHSGGDACTYVKKVKKSGLSCCPMPLIECHD
uniref:Single domain-containing protein n=1 Tax=Amblyomma maculatum TaxID=34609 RepID=G3MST3_AMBMU